MNNQKDLALFVGTISVVAVLGISSHLWIPKFLQFIGTNTNLIQGLTNFIQIILWLGILLFFVFRLYLKIQSNISSANIQRHNQDENSNVVKSVQNENKATQFLNQAETINGLTQGDNNQVRNDFKP
ncbi:hypothetical protein IQ243_01005 [Nostocales cyanobacterium LEGE 11386]|nr:hypothetical protein [Nostocales cyanobacterium LEGE 11386]